MAVYHRQQHAGGAVRNPAALFPVLHGPHIKTQAVREIPAAQVQAFADSDDPVSGGGVDGPVGQRRLAAPMGENVDQYGLNLPSALGAFRCGH